MADNATSAYVDEDGSHEDWIELTNLGNTSVSLNGWYLTDAGGEDANRLNADLRKWQFPVTSPAVTLTANGTANSRLVVWCSNKNRKGNVGTPTAPRLHTNFKLNNGGEHLALVRPDGVTVEHEIGTAPTFNYPPQPPNRTYGVTVTSVATVVMPEGVTGKYIVPALQADIPSGWNARVFDDSAWPTAVSGLGYGFANLLTINGVPNTPIITTTIPPAERVNKSIYVRFPFTIANPTGATAVRLKSRHDDGFVCYLNGVEIGSGLKPSPLLWNSASSANKNDTGVTTVNTTLNTTNGPSALVAGTNVLAFQLLNSDGSIGETDNVCLRPVLEVDTPNGFSTGFLTSATLGAANSAITTAIPPDISQVTENPAVLPVGGVGSLPILVTARVTKTINNLNATAPVRLKWRRMYDSENSITMLDDGLNGDALAGDSIFSAQVPTTSLNPGEMIRWRIEANDTASQYSFAPPYPFPNATQVDPAVPAPVSTEAEQYYGTIAAPTYVGSPQVPVLHWFRPSGTDNTGNATGMRCSFFWQPLPKDNPGPNYTAPTPIFYDNVLVNLHGQSSAGFPKKSHDLSFSSDNKFLWKDGESKAAGVNLLQNYSDKAKVRNPLAWEIWDKSGHIASHYDTLVRVQQNAAFKGLYDVVENANSAFLKRKNLDVAGALYKMYNYTDNATIVTNNANGVEKKNPDDADASDLQALVNGISTSNTNGARLQYMYDNMDIASVINFCAVHSLILNRDVGHKNYYMYRDTHGTGEWSPLPWDEDLCLGHTWNSGPGYFDDDIHSQAPLQVGVNTNRFMQVVWNTPELNNMFVRRVRSLADQWLVSATETNGPMAQRINAILNQIDPNPNNPAAGTDDADLDMRAWGFWLDAGNGAQIAYTDSRVLDHTVRAQAARITISNPVPPNPGTAAPYAGWGDSTTSLLPFITGRRDFFFSATPPSSGTVALPAIQTANPTLIIEQFDYNPTAPSGSTRSPQDYEYFVIRNPNAFAVDISGWQLSGDVSFTFRGGTVILGAGTTTTQATNSSYVNQLIVANHPDGFRARTASPRSGEFRQVTGPYNHQLNARGGSVILSRPNDPLNPSAGYTVVTSQSFAGVPTASQGSLRITELNFRPAPATSAELALVPGLVATDFEFIELTNFGATTLSLGGAIFEEGLEFTFPAGFTLASGQRCLVVASQTAFETRYGTGMSSLIAGEYQGNLDNGGERLRLKDSVGEEVLDFTYDDDWFPVPAGQYRSFVARSANPAYTAYDTPTTWALSDTQNGSPTGGDTGSSRVFEGWRWDYFTPAEMPTVLNPNTVGALTADPDGDGMNNFAEFAFGRNPRTADNPGAITVGGRANVAGTDYLCVTFRRAKNALDLTYVVEANSDLANPVGWAAVGVQVSATDLGNGTEEVCYRDTTPMGSTPRYLRVRALKP